MSHLYSLIKPIRPYATRLLVIFFIVGMLLLPFIAYAEDGSFAKDLVWAAGKGCLVGFGIGLATGIVGAPFGCLVGVIGGTILSGISDTILSYVIGFIIGIINFIASFIISLILPYVVRLLSFTIALNIQPLTHFQPILDATQVVRDFSNLILVAILIIIAMATIVGMESYGVRKTLPLLIGIALIVNFSTVIVGLVIDSGNTVMRFFWESSGFNETPMEQYIIRNMKLSQVAAQGSEADVASLLGAENFNFGDTKAVLMKAALYLIILLITLFAVYIFLRLALVFLIRIAAVWIILITAPIIFVMGAVPFGKARLTEWWKELLNWAFLGPVVFFFLFFGLIVWTQMNSYFAGGTKVIEASGTNVAYAAGAGGSRNLEAFSLFFILPIILFFFQYALNTSKKMAGNVANSLVDSAISIGKGVAFGGLALGAGAAVAGIGGNLLRRAGTKKMYERLQQFGSRPLQRIGSRLEYAHNQAVGKEAQRAQATYSGLDALQTGTLDPATGTYTAGSIIGRWDTLDARQKVTAAGILMERNETLPDNIAQEALRLAPTINKDIEKKLKRSAPNMRFANAAMATTGGVNVAEMYNYARTNNVRPTEYSPEALRNPSVAGTMNIQDLRNIARNGTSQQLAEAVKGFTALAGNLPLQNNIAVMLGAQAGLTGPALVNFTNKYKAQIAEIQKKINSDALFSLGRLGDLSRFSPSSGNPNP